LLFCKKTEAEIDEKGSQLRLLVKYNEQANSDFTQEEKSQVDRDCTATVDRWNKVCFDYCI